MDKLSARERIHEIRSGLNYYDYQNRYLKEILQMLSGDVDRGELLWLSSMIELQDVSSEVKIRRIVESVE